MTLSVSYYEILSVGGWGHEIHNTMLFQTLITIYSSVTFKQTKGSESTISISK